jgi:phage gp29-like protein
MGLINRIKNVFSEKNDTGKRPYPLGVIATRQAFLFSALNELLPNPDVILQKNNETLEIYKNFLYDAHVSSCVQSRKAGVLSLNWEINRGGTKSTESEFIEEIFNSLNLRQIISEMLDAPLFGFKPIEIYWSEVDGKIVPKELKGKPSWWFEFDSNNMLRFKDRQKPNGVLMPNKKFLVMQHNATYDNPYGESILAKCYYPVIFKKGGMKLWSVFTQKYGMPFLHGKIGLGKGQEEAYELFNVLEKLQQDGIAVTEEEVSIDILESSKTSSADIYKNLLHFCNAEISKAILSQTLTTEQGDTGSYAMSQTHLQVRKDVVDADKQLVEYWLNKLIEWIIEFNFESVSEIPRFVMYEEQDVDMSLAQRDQTLSSTGQVKFTKEYFKRNYGFKDDEIEISFEQTKPQFSESDKIREKSAFDISQFDELTQSVLKPILEMINESKSYNEIQDKIIEMFPELDTNLLEDYLAKGILLATGSGIISAK